MILVHGCYWHRHKSCKYAYTPKTRIEFWQRKVDDNVERDKRVLSSPRKQGWRVIAIWECQVAKEKMLAKRLTRFLEKSTSQADSALRNRENSSGNILTTSVASRL